MAKSKRIYIIFECTVCKSQNYTSEKNPDNYAVKHKGQNEKLKLKKYCKRCKKVTEHKEIKI